MAVGDVLMIGFTGLSAAGALYAAWAAVRSERNASSANLAARDANAVARKANELASDSNKIARSARDDARAAALDAAWDDLILALGPFPTLSPYRQPVDDVLVTARGRATLLIDKLDGWDLFAQWFAAEWQLGSSLTLEAMERSGGRKMDPEAEFQNLSLYRAWATALTSNIRHFRRIGYDGAVARRLSDTAQSRLRSLYQRNGWGEPPTDVPHLQPLDP